MQNVASPSYCRTVMSRSTTSFHTIPRYVRLATDALMTKTISTILYYDY